MTDLLPIIVKGFWCGCAAVGFGILFNAPGRSLMFIWIGGFIAGMVKFFFLDPSLGYGIILCSFFAALAAGVVSLPLAQLRDVPQIIIAIPSIIPLVPGVFAYRAMMGLMKLARHSGNDYASVISDTVYNGVMALFVIVAIVFGLIIPLFFIYDKHKRRSA